MVIRDGLRQNSEGQLKLGFATQTLTRLIKTTLFLFVFYEFSFLNVFIAFSYETQNCNTLVPQTSFLNACIQTFVHNSILLTGLEFNCTVRDFLHRGTGSSQTSMLFKIVYKNFAFASSFIHCE